MDPRIAISFRFIGGDADEHQLNFYDASRFMYGASRCIYTIEHFRQTGKVLGRIKKPVQADYRISTPQPSSWLLDVLAIAGPAIHDCAIKVPVEVLFAWAKEKLLPSKDTAAKAIELVNNVEHAQTTRSAEETKRIEAITATANNALATVNHAIALVDKALDAKKSQDETVLNEFINYRQELIAANTRTQMINA